jgi:hypothetical protein
MTTTQPFPLTTVRRPEMPLPFCMPSRADEVAGKPALIDASSSRRSAFREFVLLRIIVTARLRSSNGLTPADACVPGLEP